MMKKISCYKSFMLVFWGSICFVQLDAMRPISVREGLGRRQNTNNSIAKAKRKANQQGLHVDITQQETQAELVQDEQNRMENAEADPDVDEKLRAVVPSFSSLAVTEALVASSPSQPSSSSSASSSSSQQKIQENQVQIEPKNMKRA